MADETWRARLLDALAGAFNRIPGTSRRLEVVVKSDEPFYSEDGLETSHDHSFTDDPRFQRAYARAVRASGWDYGIRWRAHCLLWAAETATARRGAFVECGSGRGFMMSAVCEYLSWTDRPMWLVDSFKPTLPNAAGQQVRGGEVSPVYAADATAVQTNFAQWRGVRLVVGDIPGSLGEVDVDEVAFLHVDLNHALPEEAAVRHFWPRLVTGAVMVLDDYGFPDHVAQRDAHDQLAHDLGYSILTLPTGQGLVIKG